jgi:8-oxo-dGTP pyrophosphatase MutT (NUDIX family)
MDEKNNILMSPITNVGAGWKHWMIGGGLEQGESFLEGTLREVEEETGFYDLEFQGEFYCCQAFYFARRKNVWRENNEKFFLFKLTSDKTKEKNLAAYEEDFSPVSKSVDERISEFADVKNPN